jgi:hypothetical protein
MAEHTETRASAALHHAKDIAGSLSYLCEAALAAGPDYQSYAYFIAVQALAEKLQREADLVCDPQEVQHG